MKSGLIAFLMFAQIPQVGAEPEAPPLVSVSAAPRAWLGLKVVKPDETVTAHVPSLPPGMGFLVRSIDPGGPADAAGLKELDLLWKFGDQMLVNEAQLAALLRLSKPGEAIKLSGFRGGQPLELRLTLGEAPVQENTIDGEMLDSAVMPEACGGPMRVVNISDRTASFSADEGKAVVWRERNGYMVRIRGPKDEAIYEGVVGKTGEGIPENWHRKVLVLCRTLDQTLAGNFNSQRQPRPRVVPPPSQEP
jgi:PDZ domain